MQRPVASGRIHIAHRQAPSIPFSAKQEPLATSTSNGFASTSRRFYDLTQERLPPPANRYDVHQIEHALASSQGQIVSNKGSAAFAAQTPRLPAQKPATRSTVGPGSYTGASAFGTYANSAGSSYRTRSTASIRRDRHRDRQPGPGQHTLTTSPSSSAAGRFSRSQRRLHTDVDVSGPTASSYSLHNEWQTSTEPSSFFKAPEVPLKRLATAVQDTPPPDAYAVTGQMGERQVSDPQDHPQLLRARGRAKVAGNTRTRASIPVARRRRKPSLAPAPSAYLPQAPLTNQSAASSAFASKQDRTFIATQLKQAERNAFPSPADHAARAADSTTRALRSARPARSQAPIHGRAPLRRYKWRHSSAR
eukprot:TRINITY_DN8638_c0_g1_i3.p1 TRINITY_DN8638_c0_g1~~TRINITY_DN8638_c0_g1_i3.p1  ORF type:complete len:363 (+),score=49.39 TRINITY_DN8638_c0_g1_i3:49-1137(+)